MSGPWRVLLAALALALAVGAARADAPCEPVVGRLVSLEGRVEVQRADGGAWSGGNLEEPLCQGDSVRVAARSRAAVALINDSVLRLDQNSTVKLVDIGERERPSLLDLIVGAFQSFSRRPTVLQVDAPYLNAVIEGTEFVLRVAANRTELTVLEGRVSAVNDRGRAVAAQGEAVVAAAGQAPTTRVVARPRDAVEWALHYPPVLAALGGRGAGLVEGLSGALAEAAEAYGRGDLPEAFAALDRAPAGQRGARFHLFRAALLLSVGRVDEAGPDIDRALALDPGESLAYALRAVVGVVRNERPQALADGARAVELSPDAAAARIALSYAQQADFRLEAARDTLLEAVEARPEDPLARARLAELWLMLGYRGRARDEAERAVALAPGLERTQVVLGFAALAELRTSAARAAFERAIARDGGDPLPRLGLGLARIRDGDLEAGRGDIDIAVALDSNNALLRAYLGKAYFEEKRNDLAARQLEIAKQLDPNDPTAYLYDAIRKQSENRPGEALDDLQASIERNDNRAVYRGRLQLDQDRAARGTSLARVYDDLGFGRPAVNEAAKSLALDPANASAHRFLSDTLRGERRREISRVSELLQAQLLQDININPVQPSISETNLNIITAGGPAEAGFNEFTPLFERDQVRFDGTGFAGNHETFGGEAVASLLYDRFSASAGTFHFETDGFRDNNFVEHDIHNAYAQAAIMPELNVQAEVRRRDSEFGDIELNFDPDDFRLRSERRLNQDVARAGLRYSPTPQSDGLLSFIYSDRKAQNTSTETFPFPFLDVTTDSGTDTDSYQGEAQYIYRRDWFNATAGFAVSDVRIDLDSSSVIVSGPFAGFTVNTLELDTDIRHEHGYLYTNINLPNPVTWTLGVAYDGYRQETLNEGSDEEFDLDLDRFSPKFGVQWDITRELRLRGALFQTLKPALAANRFVEPTQVAGFNQFFDDVNGTISWRYGGGLDWRPTDSLFVGAEATWRDLDQPVVDTGRAVIVREDRDEMRHRGYVNWIPLPGLALGAELVYDHYESEAGLDVNLPKRVETISVPLSARYFHRSGFFVALGGTYVDQEVERQPLSTQAEGSDQFFLVDAAVGWRIPQRRGIVSLEVRNLFDTAFKYQDDSFREFSDEPSIGPYIPERSIVLRMTLSF